MQLFTGILGVAIGSSAMGSGGPITPHAATPRLHRSWETQRAGSDRSSLAASIQQQQQAPCEAAEQQQQPTATERAVWGTLWERQ
jgi:hypothetical protein